MHAENVRSVTIGTVERRSGSTIVGSFSAPNSNQGVFYFPSPVSKALYKISTFGGNTAIYYLSNGGVWTALIGEGAGLATGTYDYDVAEKCLFLVNQSINSRYISEDGTTVVSSTNPVGHLFNCPRANNINYYKGKLYVADFVRNDDLGNPVRYKTSILRSSLSLGIVSLVNSDVGLPNAGGAVAPQGNWDANTNTPALASSIGVAGHYYVVTVPGATPLNSVNFWNVGDWAVFNGTVWTNVPNINTNIVIAVTDTKYIYTAALGNILDVYRGFTKIATITVASVQSTTITLTSAPVFETGQSVILAADELWVHGTFNGKKQIRWVANPSSGGVNVKDYDTFKLTGLDNAEIKMMVNVSNVMFIANNNSISVWNDYVLQSLDSAIGCVSSKGYVKNAGSLFFIHYGGIYQSDGSTPKRISDKVSPYIYGATKAGLESCAAGTKGTSVFFAIGDVTLTNPDGSPDKVVNRVVLEYNMLQDNWFVHTGINAVEFASWLEASNANRCVYLGANGPLSDDMNVLEFLSGLTDNGRDVPMRMDSPNLMLGATFESISNPIEVLIESERGSGAKCFLSLDFGQWYEIEGESIKGAAILKVTSKDGDTGKPPRCRNIRYSLRDNSKRIYKISKIAINYIPTNEEEPVRADYDN
jgi:hypothetical protein